MFDGEWLHILQSNPVVNNIYLGVCRNAQHKLVAIILSNIDYVNRIVWKK